MRGSATSIVVLVLMAVTAAAAGWGSRRTSEADMAGAAGRFLDSLSPELRTKAAVAFDAKAREDWHYVPRQRDGVEFGEMNEKQRIVARELMRSALSSRGMNKVEEIMLLDAVLKEMEQGAPVRRDPLAYTIAVYGTPGTGKPWGWRIEGHHVSLNFTGASGGTAVTPAFLGANPAEVRQGARAGVRVLAAEEDLARELLRSLDEVQRKEAVIGETAPGDILSSPGRSLDEVTTTGLAVSAMNAAQRGLVERLLEEYAGNLRHELASHELERIRAAGIEKIRFAWMGGAERGTPHYYRLGGPTFIIEYDNTQNDANHVHTVWHDRERDFGHDLLKEHYDRGGHEK